MSDRGGRLAALAASTWCLVVLTGCGGGRTATTVDVRKAAIDARSVLLQAAEDTDPVVQIHAIEAVAQVMGKDASHIVAQGLRDPNPAVRSAAATAAGDMKLTSVLNRLKEMAMFRRKGAEPNKIVYCAVIGSLHRMGYTGHSRELRSLLFDPAKQVRAAAARALGKTGEPAAVALLQDRLADERDPMVEIQLVESMAMLGDEASARRLEGYAGRPTLDEKLATIPTLARAKVPNAVPILRAVLTRSHSPRVRVAAIGALARLKDVTDYAYEYCVAAVEQPRKMMQEAYGPDRKVEPGEVDSLQQLAAISLGWTRRPRAITVLHPLRKSPCGSVRVAAGMSILRLMAKDPARPAPPGDAVKKPTPGKVKTTGRSRKPKLRSAGAKD